MNTNITNTLVHTPKYIPHAEQDRHKYALANMSKRPVFLGASIFLPYDTTVLWLFLSVGSRSLNMPNRGLA